MGTDSLIVFPLDLREYLEDYGITSLAHACNFSPEAPRYWLAAEDLELGLGEWNLLWDKFILGLEHGRIRENHLHDSLIWTHNRHNGDITATLGYDLIAKHLNEPTSDQTQFLDLLWLFNIPSKIRCFIWLVVKNHIFTWDILLKHGWNGPGVCALCRQGEDLVQHLFIDCIMTKRVFSTICEQFCFPPLINCSVSSYLELWYKCLSAHFVFSYLPLFIYWSVWKIRNCCIF